MLASLPCVDIIVHTDAHYHWAVCLPDARVSAVAVITHLACVPSNNGPQYLLATLAVRQKALTVEFAKEATMQDEITRRPCRSSGGPLV